MITTLPIIDCRSEQEFCMGHITNATSIPATLLFQRMHELPERHLPLTICGDEKNLAIAKVFLNERQFTIKEALLWNTALAQKLQLNNQWQTGNISLRLWQPSPLINEFLQLLPNDYHLAPRQALDLACGAGRDSIYLALNGFLTTGIDYSEDALCRAQLLANINNVSFTKKQLNLEASDTILLENFTPESFDVICVFRYLHRPILPILSTLLKKEGYLIYQTFMEGCEKIGSPKNPRFLLKKNELATQFNHLHPLINKTILLSDGRPMSAFITQKTSPSLAIREQ